MDKLEKYLRSSRCNLTECLYGDDMSCEDCIERMIAEHDARVREDAMNDFLVISELLYKR